MRAFAASFLLLVFVACASTSPPAMPMDDESEDTPPSVPQPQAVDPRIFATTEQPVVYADSKIDGYEQIEAALSVEEKAAKVSIAPFLYRPTYTSLAELRFQVGQKDTITTFGAGWKWNPFSPRSKRGGAIWMGLFGNLPTYPFGKEAFKKRRAALVVDAEALQKLAARIATASGSELQDLQKDFAEKQAAYGHEAASLRQEEESLDKKIEAYEKAVAELYLTYREKLLDYRRPVPNLSYNASLFKVVGGDPIDADSDTLNDNEHRVKKHELALALDWRISERLQASGLVSMSRERENAEAGTRQGRYRGVGATIGWRALALGPERLRQSKEYRETLFIPSLTLGFSGERRECRSDAAACKDKVFRETVWTPFIDIKVKKEAQFRIGIPFSETEKFDGDGQRTLGIVTVFALQLGLPK